MAELTAEQLASAEGMSLDELKALALSEATGEPVVQAVEAAEPAVQPRTADGKFASTEEEATAEDGEPTATIYRKEIENGNGSIDVYEADSLEELVEKLSVAKLNANKKIQEFIAERRATDAKDAQITADDEYVTGEKFKKSPKQTVKEIVLETLTEQQSAVQRALDVQQHFVTTHPDYITNKENGERLFAWVKAHGHAELTSANLDEGYRDLVKSGLLETKSSEASGATEEKSGASRQTAETPVDSTQQRNPKRSSTISVRNGSRAASPANTTVSEDEMYKLPLEELRRRANDELKRTQSSE